MPLSNPSRRRTAARVAAADPREAVLAALVTLLLGLVLILGPGADWLQAP